MTHFLQDILRQPLELQRAINYLRGAGHRRLAEAAAAVRSARHVYLTGIGSSWHAALTAAPLFSLGGRPVYVQDASELVQFATIPSDAVIIVISRTGRSVEVVHLLAKARECGAIVGFFDDALTSSLSHAVAETARSVIGWQEQVADSAWFLPGSVCYFLVRGSSLGSCHEARLL